MNEETKAARESSEASWKSLEASLAAVEREAKMMAARIRRNVILELLKTSSRPGRAEGNRGSEQPNAAAGQSGG